MRRVLAVDFDDVLSETFESVLAFHNTAYGTKHSRAEIHDHNLHTLWGVDRTEAIRRVAEWFDSPYYMRMEPVHGAQVALTQLKEGGFDIAIVTSRPLEMRRQSEMWLQKHFLNLYTSLHITDQYSNPDSPITKGGICTKLGAIGLVDDVISYLEDVTKRGMRGYHFDKPWNQTESAPLVKRIYSWDEITRDLLS